MLVQLPLYKMKPFGRMCDASWGQLTFRRLHSLNIECMSVRLSMISVSELTDPFSKFKTLIFEVNNKRTNAFIFP